MDSFNDGMLIPGSKILTQEIWSENPISKEKNRRTKIRTGTSIRAIEFQSLQI